MRNVAQTVGDGAYDVPPIENAKCEMRNAKRGMRRKNVGDGAIDVPPIEMRNEE